VIRFVVIDSDIQIAIVRLSACPPVRLSACPPVRLSPSGPQ
jgi:hypothetical protein